MSLHISWQQYNILVERLALQVYESAWRFNQVICIARGGLRVGDVLSRIYELPLAILSTHSYTAEGGKLRGQLVIAEHMTMTAPRLGDRVLLVDDMVDSGHTLAAVDKEVEAGNARLSRIEQIKAWQLMDVDWLPDSDELTPTMKLKRRPIGEKYVDVIDSLYAIPRRRRS